MFEENTALQRFTDRTEPQLAFKNAYLQHTKKDASYVLTYYGIGGIGKSLLLEKLVQNLKEDPALTAHNQRKPLYAEFDFEIAQEDTEVLSRLKNILNEHHDWQFPRFEIALYLYRKNIGEKAELSEAGTYMDRQPMVKLAIDLASEIPVLGSVIKVLSYVDQGQAAFRNLMKQNDSFIKEFGRLSPSQQRQMLPGIFAEELNGYTEKASSALVMLLDTYECIEERAQGSALLRDQWLWGEQGLIRNTRNTLWVIAGRHKLQHSGIDCPMEQHLLGSLSEADASDFLSGAGIPAHLIGPICRLTEGLPIYLDVCVEHYNQILKTGETPTLSDFAGDSPQRLIERYVRYMDKSVKELVYMLSFIPEWDEALVREAATEILGSFNRADFRHAKSRSITAKMGSEQYFIHRTVAEILRRDPDNELQKPVAEFLLRRSQEILKNHTPDSDGYSAALRNMTHAALTVYSDRNALLDFFRENLFKPLFTLVDYRRYDQVMTIFAPCWTRAEERRTDALYADTLCIRAWLLYRCEDVSSDALHWILEALQLQLRLRGERDFGTITTLHDLAVFLSVCQYEEEAIGVYQYAIEQLRQFHPHEQRSLLNFKRNMAISYEHIGKKSEAYKLYQEVLDCRREVLGSEDPATLTSMSDMLICYWDQKKYADVLNLAQEMLPLLRKVCGDTHPETIRCMRYIMAAQPTNEDEIAQWEQLLTYLADVFHEAHEERLATMAQYARRLGDFKRYDEEVAMHEQIITLRKKHQGEDHPDTYRAMKALIEVYDRQEKEVQAQQLHRHLLDLRRKHQGIQHPEALLELWNFAERTTPDSDFLRQEFYDIYDTYWDNHIPADLDGKKAMLEIYMLQFDSDDKIDRLSKALIAQMDHTYGPVHPKTLSTIRQLAERDYWGSERVKLLTDLPRRYRRYFGTTHPDTLKIATELAENGAPGCIDELLEIVQALRRQGSDFKHCDFLGKVLSYCTWKDPQMALDLFRDMMNHWRSLRGAYDGNVVDYACRVISKIGDYQMRAQMCDLILPASGNSTTVQRYMAYLATYTSMADIYFASKPLLDIVEIYAGAARYEEALSLLDQIARYCCAHGVHPGHLDYPLKCLLGRMGREEELPNWTGNWILVHPQSSDAKPQPRTRTAKEPAELYAGLSVQELVEAIQKRLA